MNKYFLEAEIKTLKDKLAKSLGSKHYYVHGDYVEKIDDCMDIFIDWIKVREATEEEKYLSHKIWYLKEKLRG